MKKIWTKIKDFFDGVAGWWMFHFRNTVIDEIEFDSFVVTFRRFTMDIQTKSGNMKLRTMLMQYPQSFLLHCLSKDDTKTIHWFCKALYQFVSLITTDQGLVNDIHKAFAKYEKRVSKKAENNAKQVSVEEDKMNEDIIKANIAYAEMSAEEREEHKAIVKEILNEEE